MIRVMLVDDEALMRKGLLSLIDWADLGCEVVAAEENGRRAIDAYNKYKPQIVISDIKMPVMDGIELAKWLYENNTGAQVILLTAFSDFAYAQQAIKYRVSNYVTKTGALDEIVAAVEKCKAQIALEQAAADASTGNVIGLLKSILDGVLFRENEIYEKAQQCRLRLNEFYLFLADIATTDSVSDDEMSRLRGYAEKLLENAFENDLHYLIPIGKSRMCVILGTSISSINPSAACSEVAGVFYGMTQNLLLVGVSASHRTLMELQPAMSEAVEALSQSFYDRKGVHSYRADPSQKPTEHNSAMLDILSESLRKGSLSETMRVLHEMFAAQKAAHMPESDVKEEGIMLYNVCRRALNRVGAGVDDLSSSEAQWRSALSATKFFTDSCELQLSLVEDTCRVVSSVLYSGSNVVVDAQNYIDAHFCEPITLKDIAAAVNVNASYLSRCFKQKNGENIVDALTKKRIERAKELIAEGNLKMYEIAQTVGFNDTTYFSHVFRKHTGMSATAYQDLCSKK